MLWAFFCAFKVASRIYAARPITSLFTCVHHVIACSFQAVTLLSITLAVAPFSFIKRCKKNIRAMERSYGIFILQMELNRTCRFLAFIFVNYCLLAYSVN